MSTFNHGSWTVSRRTIPLLLLALFERSVAQDIQQLEAQLPQCATTCVQQGTVVTGCAIQDFACHCLNYNTMAAVVGPCLTSSQACTQDVVTNMYSLVNQICAYYGELPVTTAALPAVAGVDPAAATTSAAVVDPAIVAPAAPPVDPAVSPAAPPVPSVPVWASYQPVGGTVVPPPSIWVPAPTPLPPPAPVPATSVLVYVPSAVPGVTPSPTPSFDPTTGAVISPVAQAVQQKEKSTLSPVASPQSTPAQSDDGMIGAAGRIEHPARMSLLICSILLAAWLL